MTIKLAKNWRFWGIDINVFMGHLSILSLSLVLVAALFRHLEHVLSKVKNTHLPLQKCIICQVATIGSILKFESKWLMSGQTSCIASILNDRMLG